jgi:hypothetical protein
MKVLRSFYFLLLNLGIFWLENGRQLQNLEKAFGW